MSVYVNNIPAINKLRIAVIMMYFAINKMLCFTQRYFPAEVTQLDRTAILTIYFLTKRSKNDCEKISSFSKQFLHSILFFKKILVDTN